MIIIAFLLSLFGRKSRSENKKNISDRSTYNKVLPEWAKNAEIYEVNIRQHTASGTLKEFTEDIPRLKEMGIDILWIMPIQEIGVLNRKGSLGSYYSIRDYKKVNPEFGSIEDFKNLVKVAHENGMYVMLDWVANHTAWDHVWMNEHTDFYTKDSLGKNIPPIADWADVVDLNYDSKDMRKEMITAMKFWIIETDIDGFRCDVAEMVPTDFWNEAREELDKTKPVFMLAEAEQAEHHIAAFDMSYSWYLLNVMNQIAKGEKPVTEIDTIMKWEAKNFPEGSIKMRFTTNHDENSWNGTEMERYGDGFLCFSVLCYTLPGMPLLYSGQESGFDKRLRFFDKDTIMWGDYKYQEFYTKMNMLKKNNVALWNGSYGGSMEIIHSKRGSSVFAFTRKKEGNEIVAVFNLAGKTTGAQIKIKDKKAVYKDYFTNNSYTTDDLKKLNLTPWQYLVLIKD